MVNGEGTVYILSELCYHIFVAFSILTWFVIMGFVLLVQAFGLE